MKKESLSTSMMKLIMAVSLIVCIGALMGALGYFGTMPKSEVVINDGIEKEETQDEKIIQDETADWKTYQNEEYGFEVKYPEEFSFLSTGPNEVQRGIEEGSGRLLSGTISPSFDTIIFSDKNNEDAFELSIFYPKEEKVLKENYIEKYFYHYGSCDVRFDFETTEINILNINKIDIMEVKGMNMEKSIFSGCYYFKNYNDNLVVLSASGFKNKQKFEKTDLIIRKMLPTLLISEIKKEDGIDGWKTYRNEEYGFEVKYPDFFSVTEKSYGKKVSFTAENKYACVTNIEILEENIDSYDESLQSDEMTKIISKKDIFLNDYKGREIRSETSEMGLLDICILLFHNSKTYKICSCEESDMEEIFNQILSSFKFIEKETN